ncbi:MAG: hypothetical protein E7361_01495 [Clostridiales bacterium]|nr:hypothetical protein [Clostridiales bacterium]
MEVYIEYVIIDNILVNYVLLSLTSKICNLTVNRKNLIFSALIGTLFVVFMPLITNNEALLVIYRVAVGIIMTIFVRKYRSLKQWFSYFSLFVGLTFLFGGFLIATLSLFDIVYTTSGLIFLNFEIPLSLFVVPILLYAGILLRLFKYVASKIGQRALFYDISLIVNGKICHLRAFLDTGNNLIDDNGVPCVVIELKSFCKIFNNFPIHKVLLGSVTGDDLPSAHYIDVSTVNTTEKMLVFRADNINIIGGGKSKVYDNVSVAVSKKNFGDYDMILHREYC